MIDTDTKRVYPLWIHLFSDEDDQLKLMDWIDIEEWSHTYFQYLYNSGVAMTLEEVVKI